VKFERKEKRGERKEKLQLLLATLVFLTLTFPLFSFLSSLKFRRI